MTTDFLACNSD